MKEDKEYDVLLNQILSLLDDLENKHRFRIYEVIDFANKHTRHQYYPKDVSLFRSHSSKHLCSPSKRPKVKDFADVLAKMLKQDNVVRKVAVEKNDSEKNGSWEETEEGVLQLVANGLKNEFEVYQSVPNTEESLTKLRQTHCQECSAYKKVLNILKNKTEQNWVLSNPNNPSHFKIIDIRLVDLKPTQAYVETKEYWLIRWFDTLAQEYVYEYENENIQTYVLVLQPEGWRIETNNYKTNMGKVPPKIFNPKKYEEIDLTKELIEKEVQNFIALGKIEGALEILHAYAEQKKKEDLMLEVVLLRGMNYTTMKSRNMSNISFEKYQEEKQKIAKKLLKLTINN